jgi:hypothetical protein
MAAELMKESGEATSAAQLEAMARDATKRDDTNRDDTRPRASSGEQP